MRFLAWLLPALVLAAPARSPTPSPSATPSLAAAAAKGPVLIFLIDNSASLQPLDPEEKRVTALEKMFGFVEGQTYRLVLFGGRHEVFADDPTRYRNDGQWTDLYFAFARARDVMKEYPAGTEFKVILLTDAILDPQPSDWADMNVPPLADLRNHVAERTVAIVKEMGAPLYVILVGENLPPAREVMGNAERAPGLILDMVRAANGAAAAPWAQSLSAFFEDDGLLLKKFVFRVKPEEGLKKVEPVVKRIAAPPAPTVEVRFFSYLLLPAILFLLLLLGILVRSFPGPGDLEIVELSRDAPVHIAVDRLHKLQAGGWGSRGLSMVGDAKEATATLTYQASGVDLAGAGLDLAGLDPLTLEFLAAPLDKLRKSLHQYTSEGSKEEKIYVLNLEYMAQNFEAREAEQLLRTTRGERSRVSPQDYLRAKAHLLGNDALRKSLTDPRVHVVTYGRDAVRKDLVPGERVRIGPYGFIVTDVTPGGRKDARLVLYYDAIPSALGLKTWLPDALQRVFRLRRSHERVVS
jgi:nucleotide-binding universal stress UspA family protein